MYIDGFFVCFLAGGRCKAAPSGGHAEPSGPYTISAACAHLRGGPQGNGCRDNVQWIHIVKHPKKGHVLVVNTRFPEHIVVSSSSRWYAKCVGSLK